jgi:hypothetical protein
LETTIGIRKNEKKTTLDVVFPLKRSKKFIHSLLKHYNDDMPEGFFDEYCEST